MTESELIDAACQGDENAFASLARRHHEALHRFLLIRCTSDRDLDDVLQETWIAVFRYLHTYDRQWAFTTWLYRIAMREAKRIRHQIPRFFESVATTPSPLSEILRAEGRTSLWETVRQELPSNQATLLWLFYGEDKSHLEAGQILGKSESWVKVNLHRARHKLKESLAGESPWLTLKDT